MHSIVFAHYLLHSFPAFQQEHVKVVRRIIRAFTVDAPYGEVPGTTSPLSKADVQWTVDNSASLAMIAARLHIDLTNASLTPIQPMSEADTERFNAAVVYSVVLLWINTKMSGKQLDECRKSASAALKYLSLPVSQLRKNHERCKVAVSRQRLATFKLVPEDFVQKDEDEMSSRGLLQGMLMKSKKMTMKMKSKK
ncbi:hypothetical protein BDV93DRAFT_522682 [Ceratobasidium sp. AG-I]|nr:hypothetical protein BDV93DRAFT_522682 [Ceratobasidium sp. AG-I]